MTITQSEIERRESELWHVLSGVDDPELDEPVTAMGFVERAVLADDGGVRVDFRLPTYWCSPNFAFLMLDDLRRALARLSWSPAVVLVLHDHMFAEEVNAGLAAGRTFDEIFGELAGDQGLDELRASFAAKAFKRRQEAVLRGLLAEGFAESRVVAMDVGLLEAIRLEDPEAARQKGRYLAALRARRGGLALRDPAFPTWEGGVLRVEELPAYLSELRGLRINMEFNGALCRGLKQSRYKEVRHVDGEPTLVDFILDRVPGDRPGAGAGHA